MRRISVQSLDFLRRRIIARLLIAVLSQVSFLDVACYAIRRTEANNTCKILMSLSSARDVTSVALFLMQE